MVFALFLPFLQDNKTDASYSHQSSKHPPRIDVLTPCTPRRAPAGFWHGTTRVSSELRQGYRNTNRWLRRHVKV